MDPSQNYNFFPNYNFPNQAQNPNVRPPKRGAHPGYLAWKQNEEDREEVLKYTVDKDYVYPSRKELKHPDWTSVEWYEYYKRNPEYKNPFTHDTEEPEEYEEGLILRARELGVHPGYLAWKQNEEDREEVLKYTVDKDYVYPSRKELKHPDWTSVEWNEYYKRNPE